MCGLRSKLNIPEFIENINKFDIFSCFETFCDNSDVINVNNCSCFLKNRSQNDRKRSGGIATFIKDTILEHFEEIHTECEYVQWFKLPKKATDLDEDVIFGAIYMPPENSKYCDKRLCEMFYAEIDSFNT